MRAVILVAIATVGVAGAYGQNASAPTGAPATLQGTWVCMAKEAAFSPRDTAEGVVFNNALWLSNGYFTGNILTRDLWRSGDGANWERISEATPYDGYAEMVVFEDRIWAVKESVWNSADGANWQRVLDRTPFGVRGYGELVVHDGKMWQLGSGEDVWCTTDGVTWNCVQAHAPFGARCASAVASYAGKLWLMGGRLEQASAPPEKHYAQYTTFNDVWCSADGVQWERVAEHAPWAPRMWHAVAVYRDRLWILGGFDNRNSKNFGDVWYTQDGVTWQQFVGETCFQARHEPTCYIFNDALWVVDGNCWPVVNDVWRIELKP